MLTSSCGVGASRTGMLGPAAEQQEVLQAVGRREAAGHDDLVDGSGSIAARRARPSGGGMLAHQVTGRGVGANDLPGDAVAVLARRQGGGHGTAKRDSPTRRARRR